MRGRGLSFMPRAKTARGKVRGALPRIAARGTPPETPGPLPLLLYVPERPAAVKGSSGKSSQMRKRFSGAAHTPRALDRCGPFRRLAHEKGKRANAKPSQFAAGSCLPLVGYARISLVDLVN